MPLLYPLLLSAALFGIGLYGVLARRNAVLVLVGVELMLNAVTLQLVAYDAWFAEALHTGQVLALFVIALAAAEIGLGLAIVLALFRATGTIDVDVSAGPDAARSEEPAR
jgi:NADH-quinone oxidoreductase subunit K